MRPLPTIGRLVRTPLALTASLVLPLLLLSGCRELERQEFVDLDSYSLTDLSPFEGCLVDDELAEHPELSAATVYHLRLNVADTLTDIDARARIRYTNREPDAIEEIPLFFYANLTPGKADVGSVVADGVSLDPELRDNDSRLIVKPPQGLESGRSLELTVDFRLSVPVTEKGEYGGFGYSGKVLSLAYAYPMITAFAGWEHPLPVPYGDFLYNEVSFYLVQVSMPSELSLAAPGVELCRRQANERTEIVFALGPARDLYMALAEELAIKTETVGRTVIRSFAPADAEAASELVLATAAAALGSFGARFGSYPYTSLTLVSIPFSAFGLEFPAIILNARRLYDLSQVFSGISASVLLESTTAHEVAHQWFYSSVGNDQIMEPWIDEALAQYGTWLYYGDRYGESAAGGLYRSFIDRWDRVGRAEIPIGGPVSAYTPKEYGAIVYGRGPLFIEALFQRMGEERFDSFLLQYCREFEWKLVDTAAFQAAAEAACRCSLEELFADWVK